MHVISGRLAGVPAIQKWTFASSRSGACSLKLFLQLLFLYVCLSCSSDQNAESSAPATEASEQAAQPLAVPQQEEPLFEPPANLNFAEHIAPLIHQNCTPCHRPEGAAPFSLISYQDVAKRAKDIRYVTGHRIMPPWKADPSYVSHKNERVLSPAEISLIHAWIDSGLVAGSTPLPEKSALQKLPAASTPDLLLKMTQPNRIKGDNQEYFLLNYIPFELEEEQWVKSIEFVGGNRRLLHHCTYYVYEVDPSVDLYGDNGPFNVDYTVKHTEAEKQRHQELSRHMSFYGGWIPGSGPVYFPDDIGFRMPKRGMLMLTMHYAPSPVNEEDLSSIRINFHESTPRRQAQTITMGTGGVGRISPPLVLKPETTSSHTVVVPINTDVSLISVWPHMHLLGKSFKAYAITPASDTVRLVRIPEWDFNWQSIYYFHNLVKIPKGSTLYIDARYDNTSKNINNPFHPPRRVVSRGNMATTDEMLTMMMMFLKYEPGDEKYPL
jgi:hypothetical protein